MEPQAKTFNSSRPSVIYFHGIRVKYIQDDKKTLSKEFEKEESDSNSAIPALTVKRTWMSDNGHDSKTQTAGLLALEHRLNIFFFPRVFHFWKDSNSMRRFI